MIAETMAAPATCFFAKGLDHVVWYRVDNCENRRASHEIPDDWAGRAALRYGDRNRAILRARRIAEPPRTIVLGLPTVWRRGDREVAVHPARETTRLHAQRN